MVLAAGTAGWRLRSDAAWLSAKAESTGLEMPARKLWRVLVRAHGFAALTEVAIVAPSTGVEVVGRRRIFGLVPRNEVSFLVSVSTHAEAAHVLVTGRRSDGSSVVRRVVLGDRSGRP